MISSKFLLKVTSLILGNDHPHLNLSDQINFLEEKELVYTEGNGLFAYFNHLKQEKYFKFGENVILDGLKIISKEQNIEAEALLHIKNGVIDYLEIWCSTGNYPNSDLKDYQIKQVWDNSKEIIY